MCFFLPTLIVPALLRDVLIFPCEFIIISSERSVTWRVMSVYAADEFGQELGWDGITWGRVPCIADQSQSFPFQMLTFEKQDQVSTLSV